MNFDPLSKDYPRILVHSLHDKSYPNIQPDEFGWFRTNLLGFYQEGLEIYVDHEKILLEIDTGEWTTVARGPQDFTLPNCYELAYIRRIGKIHISKIKDINYDGDKYYSDVHIYCDFKNDKDLYDFFDYKMVRKGAPMKNMDDHLFQSELSIEDI